MLEKINKTKYLPSLSASDPVEHKDVFHFILPNTRWFNVEFRNESKANTLQRQFDSLAT